MSNRANTLRTQLGRVRGLGSAHHGVGHWWAQRVTAVALVPLAVWFVASIVALAGADHAAVVDWIGRPVPAILLVALIVAVFHHAQLGVQVVIEDYVHHEGVKIGSLLAVKAVLLLLALAAVFAVLRIALGG
ncbi:MAG TPA: succinate dehydrogenase, hydrophobic membrane anchor protein [Alphaproteobacteria bacterium]